MAIEKEYTLKLSTKQAQENIDELNKSLKLQEDLINDIEKEIRDYEKQLNKTSKTDLAARKSINDKIKKTKERLTDEKVALKDVTKDRKRANKSLKETSENTDDIVTSNTKLTGGLVFMKRGIQAVGVALKSLGIGLIIAGIAALAEALSRNKKVMDGLEVALTTVGNVFSQITNAIEGTYTAITSTSENFDALGRVINGLITLSINPFLIVINNLMLGLNAAALAYQTMFGDAVGIIKAQKAIDETRERIGNLTKEMITAGSDVIDGFGEAISEVANIGKIIEDEFSKVSIKNAKAQADNYKAAKDAAILAQAQSSALRAAYELEAAELKKIRDNVNLSLEDRIKANNDLAVTSALVEEQMKRQAQLAVNLAALEVQRNNSSENQAALIQANADLKAVEADIAGKTEEIETNRVGLLNEQNALLQTQIDGERERNLVKAEFEAEQEEDPLAKLELQRVALENENLMILEDIEAKRELYALGTQARVDAEENFKNEKLRIDNEIATNTKTVAEVEDKIKTDADNKKIQDEESVKNAKIQIAQQGLNILGTLAKEGSDLAKGVAIAQATMNTYLGVTSALSAPSTIPEPFGTILKFANAAAIGVSGFMNVKKIIATKPVEKTAPAGGGVGPSGPSAPAPPAFNVVGQSDTNQLADAIGGQTQQPIQAFVVSSEVTTAQELDRNIVSDASIG